MATTGTLDFFVNPVGIKTAAQLATQVATATFDHALLTMASCRLTSDVTSVVGGQVRRRLILDLTMAPYQAAPVGILSNISMTPAGFQLQLKSTSALDGSGKTVTVFYTDPAGGAHNEIIVLQGQVLVKSVNTNYAIITDVQPAFRNAGKVLLYGGVKTTIGPRGVPVVPQETGVFGKRAPGNTVPAVGATALAPNLVQTIGGAGQGALSGEVPQLGGIGELPECFEARFPTLAAQTKMLTAWLYQSIQQVVGPCLAAAPVIA